MSKTKITEGPWRYESEPFEDGKPYAIINAGNGFYDFETNTGFHLTGLMSDADALTITAAPELLSVAKRFCEMIDDDPERFTIAEPSCNECTMGCTPIDQDKGLCAYHTAKAIINRMES
jgi:hypothetical protein